MIYCRPVKIIVLCCFSYIIALHAENDISQEINAVMQMREFSAEQVTQFGKTPVLSRDGRLEPMNTFSSEALRKLHHAKKIYGHNSDRFLLSLRHKPELWMDMKFIYLSNRKIALKYNLSNGYCSYNELFDSNGNYKLQKDLEAIYIMSPSKRSRLDKDLIKLDEQINVFYQLINHEIPEIYSEKNGLTVYDQKINIELLYNRLDIFSQCKKIYLISGGLLLVLSFIAMFWEKKWIKRIMFLLAMTISVGLLYHLSGIIMRWYIAGYAPFSNSYETMIHISFIAALAGIIFIRKSMITFALATLLSGIILFVSGLNWMDPQIGLLVPVLKSPWLMIHVAVIVAAYSFFGISFFLGINNLVLLLINKGKKMTTIALRIRELSIINEISLWAGLALMTAGTFIGAVWANETWGRYWGWDPKESWALITIVVYAIATHLRLIKKGDNPYLLNLMSVIAFLSVLMTYFGVNYLLNGMHSYG
ncbi:MAG: cytochrome c biogenesis protein CcsA [Dysgonamonadaceae bacterium]|jgi:cytochrome c-type biogenesis protein CcsB|nr:cytochrome c biogenesis protein CcsA [Dysgonamonadaceae bacterium]